MVSTAQVNAAFLALAEHSEVAASVCAAVSAHRVGGATEIRRLCTASGIALSQSIRVQEFLTASAEQGLFRRRTELTWEPASLELHAALAPMFTGCALYKQRVHRDRDVVEVVITKPPAPSRFNDELAALQGGGWGLIDTEEALPAIAEAASERFCLMTPYVDAVGAPVVANLFQRVAPDVRKVLIVRAEANDEMPLGLEAVRPILKELNVSVLNFRVERGSARGNETSHAKVVLADDVLAYVGSLNMNRWSLEYSLELGVRLRGAAARDIARVVDAAERVCSSLRC